MWFLVDKKTNVQNFEPLDIIINCIKNNRFFDFMLCCVKKCEPNYIISALNVVYIKVAT
jgi:hypothetical protein